MAYYTNPIFGYYPQMQPMMMQQPMMYPQQQMVETNNNAQPQQSNTMDSLMVWVQGKPGAQSYPVARGTTVPLFDSEGDFVYIKSVDSNGIPLPLVTKVISDPPSEKSDVVAVEEMKVDMSDYVTKGTYEDLKKKYDDLEVRILELETKPTSSFNSTFTGNTFNNTKKEGGKNESKFSF